MEADQLIKKKMKNTREIVVRVGPELTADEIEDALNEGEDFGSDSTLLFAVARCRNGPDIAAH